jgi:4-amino-4-deoxy-L-arabinose transferase-like glycosyltransferase
MTVWEDGDMAENLVRTGAMFHVTHGVANHSFTFPVYASLVAITYEAFGVGSQAVLALNLALGSLNAWVLALLFGRLFDRLDVPARWRRDRNHVVALAVFVFLVHPVIAYYAMRNVHPLGLDMLVLDVVLLESLRAADSGGTARDCVRVGVVLGLALLTRTTLAVGVFPFFLRTWRHARWATPLRRGLVVAAVALAIGFPWLAHNYATEGVIGYTSTTGEILWKGSLEGSTGSNYLSNGKSYLSALTDEDEAHLASIGVDAQNRWFFAKFVDEVRESPRRTASLYVGKLRSFFWFRSDLGSEYGEVMRRGIPLYKAFYVTLLGFALVSSFVVGRTVWPVLSVAILLGAFQSLFYVETRHRVVVEPLLAFLAVVPIPAAVRFVRTRAWQTRAPKDSSPHPDLEAPPPPPA